MRSLFAVLRRLVLPAGAPAGNPRVEIGGPPFPAGLVAYFAGGPWDGNPETVVAGTLFYGVGTGFEWDVEIQNLIGFGNGPIRSVGRFDPFSGTQYREIYRIIGDTHEWAASTIEEFNGSVEIKGPFGADGFTLGRGTRQRIDSASGTAAGGAEAVVLTTGNVTFVAGRAYRIRWATDQVSSVANVVAFRVRRTGIAGTVLYLAQFPVPTGAGAQHRKSDVFYVRNSTAADITDILVLTAQASAGTTTGIGSATQVRYLEAEDAGDPALFPNAFAIV